MGIFDKLKALGDPRYGIESTIETQARIVESLRNRFPERDMNAWLAYALRGRAGFGGREDVHYFKKTVVFAAALPEIAMRGLGLSIALEEASNARISGQVLAPYDAQFGQILRVILQFSGETLSARWEMLNPWTAEHFPDVQNRLMEMHRQWHREARLASG